MTSLATPPIAAAVPDRLEFRFIWNAAEHRRLYSAVRRVIWRRAWYRRLLPAAVVFIVVAEAAVLAVSPVPLSRVASGSSPYLVLIAFWIVLIRWGVPYLSARTYARNHQRRIPHDQVRVVTADGIEAHCVTTNVKIQWAGITRVIETPEFFLIFTGPTCAFDLPKRAVPDAESLRALRGIFWAGSRFRYRACCHVAARVRTHCSGHGSNDRKYWGRSGLSGTLGCRPHYPGRQAAVSRRGRCVVGGTIPSAQRESPPLSGGWGCYGATRGLSASVRCA